MGPTERYSQPINSMQRAASPPRVDATARSVPSPLSSSQAFDDAFDILKSRFSTLLLPVAAIILPTHLVLLYIVTRWLQPMYATLSAQGDQADIGKLLLTVFGYALTGDPRNSIPGIASLFVPVLASVPVTVCVVDYLLGRPISLSKAVGEFAANFTPIAACAILGLLCCLVIASFTLIAVVIVISVIIAVLSYAVASLANGAVPPALGVIALIAFVVIPYVTTCFFFGRTFALIIPAMVVEKNGILAGIARSQQLLATVRYSTTLGTLTLLPIMVFILQYALGYGAQAAIKLIHLSPSVDFMLTTAASALVSCLVQAYWMVYIARVYIDYRVKRECLDVRMLSSMEPSL